MERHLTQGGEHTMQYTDDVLQNCALKTCMILLTNAIPQNLTQVHLNNFPNKFNNFKKTFNIIKHHGIKTSRQDEQNKNDR